MYFFDVDGSEYHTQRAGVSVRALTGHTAQFCFITLAPGTTA